MDKDDEEFIDSLYNMYENSESHAQKVKEVKMFQTLSEDIAYLREHLKKMIHNHIEEYKSDLKTKIQTPGYYESSLNAEVVNKCLEDLIILDELEKTIGINRDELSDDQKMLREYFAKKIHDEAWDIKKNAYKRIPFDDYTINFYEILINLRKLKDVV